MSLRFRNIDASPSDPVEDWGFEGLLAAVDRGSLAEWRRIGQVVRADPWGDVARTLSEVFEAAEDRGVVAALRETLDVARREHTESERRQIADELRAFVEESGLTQGEFAARMRTSRPRLNAYLNAKVVPSAVLYRRAQALAEARHRA